MRTNIENTRSLLHEYELSAKKTLGQNFLISQNIVDSIIDCANISNEDIVFEIAFQKKTYFVLFLLSNVVYFYIQMISFCFLTQNI